MIIQLKEFIRTGKFGPISLGSTKADIIRLLGKKNDFADCGETQIVKYGWYEFFYYTKTEIVFGIQNDHVQADGTNHHADINFRNVLWTLDKWFLKENENVTFGQVVDYLNEEKISFEIIPPYHGSEGNIIRCSVSGVKFDFADEYRIMELNAKGKFKDWKIVTAKDQSKHVLNGIRLFA
jgi:hypothetical protein